MLLEIEPGSVAVPTANNTGTVLCHSDAVETLTLDPAPPSGQNRADLIICQARGADLDGGTDNDFIFAFITGVPYVPPFDAVRDTPATPPGAVALERVDVVGGSAALNPAYMADLRPGILAVAPVNRVCGPDFQSVVTTDAWGNWTVPLPADAAADLGRVVVANCANQVNPIFLVRHLENESANPAVTSFRTYWHDGSTFNNGVMGVAWIALYTVPPRAG
jgi:hypothetical protein